MKISCKFLCYSLCLLSFSSCPNDLFALLFFRICRTFEDICNRVSELPEKTAELVELTHFMIQSRDVTVFDLNAQILNIAENLLFIIDRTILPGNDSFLSSIERHILHYE